MVHYHDLVTTITNLNMSKTFYKYDDNHYSEGSI